MNNREPTADPISFRVSLDMPYAEQALSGDDPDGDALSYELLSPLSGAGYSEAVIVPHKGILYLILEPGFLGEILLEYAVFDGRLLSESAEIRVEVFASLLDDHGTGDAVVDPQEYGGFATGNYGEVLLAGSSGTTSLPSSIDLSANFPVPGNQGSLGSCVGWATAYALKTYQERVEVGWEINTKSHVFSPSYVFNQIALPGCNGSYINQALDLLVSQGCATLASMPYSDNGCGTQPMANARSEASVFRANRWVRLSSSTDVKKALMNRQPVVIGMTVYPNFYRLAGTNSVYNSISGEAQGGHALTITGYNDAKYGGAFRVINSWGTDWGDKGYFWLPYSQLGKLVTQLYTLEDAENSSDPTTPDDPVVPAPGGYPNLSIRSWDADIGTQPGGGGTLRYKVVNTGEVTAPAGFNICFMLSKDRAFTRDDIYLLWETVPFELKPGASVYRDASNPIWYPLPQDCEYGPYYPALWVDDLNAVQESNENDNVAVGNKQLNIAPPKPDLELRSSTLSYTVLGRGCVKDAQERVVEKDSKTIGAGSVKYKIYNASDVVVEEPWKINVVLAPRMSRNSSGMQTLYSESVASGMQPQSFISRTDNNPGTFNLMRTYKGGRVKEGDYYLGLLVDADNDVDEAVELYNDFWLEDKVFRVRSDAVVLVCSKGDAFTSETPVKDMKAYEYREDPSKLMSVEIVEDSDGRYSLDYIDEAKVVSPQHMQKSLHSADFVAFPVAEEYPMP